ncbi:heterokaryon incompatibility protein [Colletotrichum graminicola]|uniref:Heterokaryon incompatibility protein n=1 Tax=Colletotrichum graminicola (strain M1.001 / M2 / FGSC 10212) TaxID=645133 RepID=E3QTD0_COLGM|nr:heterokaryon incompatibility protein [Colletotrichum graminicola M1.001]EFQ34118.1 heterokaryon incompatibility protein [Colletotrichum graminicola M1.001]WDK20894.1 heterokaryon incompatibility protein [Colletotrichum graminicola]
MSTCVEPLKLLLKSRLLDRHEADATRNAGGETLKCEFCDNLIAVLEKTPTDHVSFDFGPIDKIASSRCDRHRLLIQRITKWLDIEDDSSESLKLFQNYFRRSFSFTLGDNFARNSPEFDVMQGSNNNHLAEHGVKLDPSWIDNETLTRWYNTCISEHGELCNSPRYFEHLPKPRLKILIDAVDNCLITAPDDPSYMALSYVWGKVDMPRTFITNLQQLKRPGALENISLPRIIRHTMHLTALFGARYLWVDSLCVVQDDREFLSSHLRQMASIFAHAQAVIIPVDGTNAESSIRGLKGTPREEARHLEQDQIQFGDRSLLVRTSIGQHQHGEARSRKSNYFDRGWTFQEYLFARRRICFENESAWFECCQSAMYEDHSHPDIPDRKRDFLLNVGYPSLTVYSRLMEDYNNRQLTYPQDCLSAMAGILPCYTRVFKGGFLCGLPEMFFDAALLWQPKGDLVRRKPVETSMGLGVNSTSNLPTWSWVGWQGRLDFADWATGNDFVAACSGWIASTRQQLFPTTKWYTSAGSSGEIDKRPIEVEWAAWRERYRDPGKQLPPGWTRRKRRKDEELTIETPPDGFGKYLYHHTSCDARFWYPVPLSDPTYSHQKGSSAVSEEIYLFGSVELARLTVRGAVWMHSIPNLEGNSLQVPHVSLYTPQDEWAGILRLHSHDYLETRKLDPTKSPVEVQLIAISQGFIPNNLEYGDSDFAEYTREERLKQGQRYEFYNVMWISWRDGIAYREGLGRVCKETWDALQASTIDIVLG